jgi:hypothetical protein
MTHTRPGRRQCAENEKKEKLNMMCWLRKGKRQQSMQYGITIVGASNIQSKAIKKKIQLIRKETKK